MSNNTGKRSVLVIDDDETTRQLVIAYLTRAGYVVNESPGSLEALRAISETPPDLVLADIHMPGLDGFGLLSALRAQDQTAKIPIILMTANADHSVFRRAMKLGADDFLTKPLEREELLDSVAARFARFAHLAPQAPVQTPAPVVPQAPDDSATMRITDYKLVRKIAEGGMSSIYLADQVSTGIRVVLKMIPLNRDADQEIINRFTQEHALLERLQHPNIVNIHAQGFNEDHLYIAMEYFQHGSLHDVLSTGAALTETQSFEYACQIAKGLEAAHRAGIVHRDLKPDNVMIRKDHTLALTDFGIAKDLNQSSSLTMHGDVFGTPSYVAPEQALGEKVGPAADVYSLGVILFQMLTGRKPYVANDPQNVIFQHINSPTPKLPDDLTRWQDLIDFMMAKSPQLRPRDASAVLACFRALGVET